MQGAYLDWAPGALRPFIGHNNSVAVGHVLHDPLNSSMNSKSEPPVRSAYDLAEEREITHLFIEDRYNIHERPPRRLG